MLSQVLSLPLPVAQGGTGSTTAAAARTALGLSTPGQAVATSTQYLGLILGTEYDAGATAKAKTLIVGELTPIDLGAATGGALDGNVVITLPSGAHGDRCGLIVTRQSSVAGSFPAAPGYCAELANATSVNGATYTSASTGSGKWGLWLTGERLVFRYQGGGAAAGWFVEVDGRIPHSTSLKATETTPGSQKSQTKDSSAPYTVVQNAFFKVQVSASESDNCGCGDTTNSQIKHKRANDYHVILHAQCSHGTSWNSTTGPIQILTALGDGAAAQKHYLYRAGADNTQTAGGASPIVMAMAAAEITDGYVYIGGGGSPSTGYLHWHATRYPSRLIATEVLR